MIRIGIVDDKASNRNIIKDKLERTGMFIASLIASDGSDFLHKLRYVHATERPEVVLMDLEMPNMDGVAAIAAGSSLYPEIKFVVLTIYDDEEKIFKAIKAGAYGYLLKDESGPQIADMLWQMCESGAGPISPGIAHKILQLVQKNQLTMVNHHKATVQESFFDLSDREQEILKLLVQGFLYKEIGAQLNISPNTAKKHVINIYQKLHVNSKAQAIKLAYDKGML
ncbi:MAG: response regulator transcription factor [Chitinophagaceae bacterium]